MAKCFSFDTAVDLSSWRQRLEGGGREGEGAEGRKGGGGGGGGGGDSGVDDSESNSDKEPGEPGMSAPSFILSARYLFQHIIFTLICVTM